MSQLPKNMANIYFYSFNKINDTPLPFVVGGSTAVELDRKRNTDYNFLLARGPCLYGNPSAVQSRRRWMVPRSDSLRSINQLAPGPAATR